MLMPSSLAILGQSFSGEAKGRAIGIWAAAGAAGAALGPVLGGWLIDAGSWRLIFLINLPLAVGGGRARVVFMSAPMTMTVRIRSTRLGAVLATAGLGLATWALTEGSGRGWSMLGVCCAGGEEACC